MLHVKQRVQYRVIHHLFDVSNLITSIMKQKKLSKNLFCYKVFCKIFQNTTIYIKHACKKIG